VFRRQRSQCVYYLSFCSVKSHILITVFASFFVCVVCFVHFILFRINPVHGCCVLKQACACLVLDVCVATFE